MAPGNGVGDDRTAVSGLPASCEHCSGLGQNLSWTQGSGLGPSSVSLSSGAGRDPQARGAGLGRAGRGVLVRTRGAEGLRPNAERGCTALLLGAAALGAWGRALLPQSTPPAC
jgi:hypothetical protein